MAKEIPKPIDPKDDKSRAAFQRLLLSKQLYMHGLEHSNNTGMLDKMIAVHNFHSAIEIALKAILLHYDITAENQLDMRFSDMIKAINKHGSFKEKGMVLPYQQQILNLNQYRNLVQHHGFEPEASSMDHWRVYSLDFLTQVCQNYFAKSYDDISSVDLIDDLTLRGLMNISLVSLHEQKYGKSAIFSKMGFEWARSAILTFLPDKKVVPLYHGGDRLHDVLKKLEAKADNNLYFSALLSSGVKFVDYKRFLSKTPVINFGMSGTPWVDWVTTPPDYNGSLWVHDFVVKSIIHWQFLGLSPSVRKECRETTQQIIDDGGTDYDPKP